MPLISDTEIARVLGSVKTIALLGASPKAERPSHEVMGFLLAKGYEVYPVNPGLAGSELLGREVYASLGDIPLIVDMVDVFRNASFLPQIVDEVLACGPQTLWTQLGVVDAAAAQRAEAGGVEVVMDRCPAIEWPRLRAAGLL
ncbi:CoA-binding protein [Congregibacter litoralis]|uniref:Putative CoA-binding protein n=1 Tax=Congregibacter litoralis KT71 TaxID=314285 RepID=A4A770_9GAMM|nr:putative CoA-binding protein [Congregibacter litoralis KT71]